jgi:hypothetical protein
MSGHCPDHLYQRRMQLSYRDAVHLTASISNRASAISALLDRKSESAVDDSEANEKDDVDGVGDECSMTSSLEDASNA